MDDNNTHYLWYDMENELQYIWDDLVSAFDEFASMGKMVGPLDETQYALYSEGDHYEPEQVGWLKVFDNEIS